MMPVVGRAGRRNAARRGAPGVPRCLAARCGAAQAAPPLAQRFFIFHVSIPVGGWAIFCSWSLDLVSIDRPMYLVL